MEKIYDVLILGGGVAGMTAAVYAKRAGKSVAIVEKSMLGGQILQLEKIENFPSQREIDGITLAGMFSKQVKALDIEVIKDEIMSVDFSVEIKQLFGKKEVYSTKNVIIATGISTRKLGVGEDNLLGQGVSYCAVCDGNFFKGKEVCVASQKGSGIKDALYLCNIASKVTLLDTEDMSIYASVNKNAKLEIISNCKIQTIEKDKEGLELKVKINGAEKDLNADGLFVELGKIPATEIFEGQVELDAKGFVKANENMETSAKGVYVAGDVRNGMLKQIVTACADGALAAGRV